MAGLNVLTICGSLRKGSYNAMVQRALPSLAPEGMTLKPAPSFTEFPLYNADIQNSSGFPAPVNTLADAIRAADGVIFCTPEYNFGIPGGLKNAIDWVSRLPNQPFAGKPVALQSASRVHWEADAFSTTCAAAWCFSMRIRSTSRKFSLAIARQNSMRKPASSRMRQPAASSSSSLRHLRPTSGR